MINIANIPKILRERAHWVLWKWIERDGKRSKPPFQISGEFASSIDAATWTGLDAAVATLKSSNEFNGIGYTFTGEDPFCGIDLDGCRNPETGEIAEWARKIIDLLDSYTEVSPSRTGVKIFVIAQNPLGRGKKKISKCQRSQTKSRASKSMIEVAISLSRATGSKLRSALSRHDRKLSIH